jgi:hypothetical protein
MVSRCACISISTIAFISTILLIIGTSTLPSKPAITYNPVSGQSMQEVTDTSNREYTRTVIRSDAFIMSVIGSIGVTLSCITYVYLVTKNDTDTVRPYPNNIV